MSMLGLYEWAWRQVVYSGRGEQEAEEREGRSCAFSIYI